MISEITQPVIPRIEFPNSIFNGNNKCVAILRKQNCFKVEKKIIYLKTCSWYLNIMWPFSKSCFAFSRLIYKNKDIILLYYINTFQQSLMYLFEVCVESGVICGQICRSPYSPGLITSFNQDLHLPTPLVEQDGRVRVL